MRNCNSILTAAEVVLFTRSSILAAHTSRDIGSPFSGDTEAGI